VLTIAGSDSGGGAGIQADLKAFAACAVHGMCAITAITAQNTTGVDAVHVIPPELIIAQVRAVAGDIGVDAVKIGMLGNRTTIEAVAQALDELPRATPVVLDPVMVAESGAELLEPTARTALIDLLLPRASVVTPNVAEARALVAARGRERTGGAGDTDRTGGAGDTDRPGGTGDTDRPGGTGDTDRPGGAEEPESTRDAAGRAEVEMLARRVHALGPSAVVVTGGHRERATDVFFDGATLVELPGERYPGGAAHGSGCTHSSVLAARLAGGDEPVEAARLAKELAARAVRDGLVEIGEGAGPVDILEIRRRRGEAVTAKAATRF